MTVFAGVAVVAWALFLWIFRVFWPAGHEPGGALTTFALWFAVGGLATYGGIALLLRAMGTPRAWRPAAGVALTAPALCLDMLATLFFDRWFPAGAAGDDRIYPALILVTVGAILLALLATSETPKAAVDAR
ncbi:MAG: hypothetical protein AAF772_14435, partial [Acidobacteriota bacterium]